MQQSLIGCAFCDAQPGTERGEARTWGKDELVTLPICVDCALQTTPDERDHRACDSCGLVVNAVAALTGFRVRIGRLEGTIRRCAHCAPDGPATYWTRELEEHVVDESLSVE